jgi:hypothetical protein
MAQIWLYKKGGSAERKDGSAELFDTDKDDMQKLNDEGWRDSPVHPDFNEPPESDTTSMAKTGKKA